MGASILPRVGSRIRNILEMLPATNAEISERFGLHYGETGRIMSELCTRGLAINSNPGRGNKAFYVRTEEAK